MRVELQGWMVDVNAGTSGPFKFVDDLADMYRWLECDCIDIVLRYIEGLPFLFIVDDEGLLKDSPRVSAVNIDGTTALVGNLLVVAPDEDGEMRSLTDDEMDVLKRNSAWLLVREVGRDKRYNVRAICNVEYRPGARSHLMMEMERWRPRPSWTGPRCHPCS